MRVLIACEFSGVVRDAFRAKGHDAWSCDLKQCEADPSYHIQGDAVNECREAERWDLLIAHPPCTHLSCSGAAWFEAKRKDGRQAGAIALFMAFAEALVPRICIENPVGIMSTAWRKPDQVIQPYYFGDSYQKTTCLWLKSLHPLMHSAEDDLFYKRTHVDRGEMVTFASGRTMPKWYAELRGDGHKRSKTFPGIAAAMAEQWGQL